MSQFNQDNGSSNKHNKLFDQFANTPANGGSGGANPSNTSGPYKGESYRRPPATPPQSKRTQQGASANTKSTYTRSASQQGAYGKTAPGKAGSGGTGSAGSTGNRRSVNKKRRRKQRRLTGAIIALSLAIVVIISVFSIYSILASRINGENTEAGTLPEEVKTLPEYTGKGIITMLVCGLDYDNENADGFTSEDKVGRTDLILYMVYDTINNKVNLLQIPRDTYVGNKVETGNTGKINGLYFFSEDPDNRMAPLATVINDQLGLPVDYYVTIDMDAVKEIIDIMPNNSIRVYVPVEVSDPKHPEAVIAPGWRDFTSSEAEFFLRNRTSPSYQQQGDVMRLQMQQSFYSAMFREFTSLAPSDLLMWMKVLLYRVNTDMDPMQLGGLAQKALKLTAEDLIFIRPPVSGAALGDVSLLSLVPDETADLLNEYFRPDGQVIPVEDLNIQTLPVIESVGVFPASIRKMADVQAGEPPVDIPDPIVNYPVSGA